MKARIRILPEQLCNQIAAGEVVERPASVVKELLENALDAGAGEILVEVEAGGKRLIRIIDDGSGMGRDDVLLCVERHATSKIAVNDDLFRLQTFGFRGEALPSIAAVSRLTISSRTAEAEAGWEVYLEGGVVRRSGAIGIPTGTTVEVRNLFFNTPARRKFLRRDETELGHVGEVVTKTALAHAEVRFRLVHNGRTLLDVYRQHSLEERVASLLGRPLLEELLPLCRSGERGLAMHGLVAQPSRNRSAGSAIYTYINGRYIRDRVVQHAILEGYRNLLPKGRYPMAVLFLDMDPELVDVNVHPTKHEVRFREQGEVHDFIVAALRDTLRPSGWLAGRHPTPGSPGLDAPVPNGGVVPPPPLEVPGDPPHQIQETLGRYAQTASLAMPSRAAAPLEPASETSPCPEQPDFRNAVLPAMDDPGFFGGLTVLGQFRRSYILCQDGDDLLIIDQHAAHERIGFERLKAQFLAGGIERQRLLFPTILELTFRDAAVMSEQQDELARLGFEVEPFGGNAFAVKAVPQLLADTPVEGMVRDLIADLASIGRSGVIEAALDRLLIGMACHGMVRANQSLNPVQIRALLLDLDGVDFRGHCPHGRPVLQRLTLTEIERMFKRK